MIDLHTHILPAIDDGPPDLKGSLALAVEAVGTGTSIMVATPHVDHTYGVSPFAIRDHVDELLDELDRHDIPLGLVAGAEVAATRAVEMGEDELAAACVGRGPWLLLECPLIPESVLEGAAMHVRRRGCEIILAHPERSPGMRSDPDRLVRLVDAGCVSSITDGSLRGRFGRDPQRAAIDFLADGLVHNVTSDAHSARTRGPGVRAGLEAAEHELPGVTDLADWLTQDVPKAIIEGTSIPPRPAVELGGRRQRSGLLRRRRRWGRPPSGA